MQRTWNHNKIINPSLSTLGLTSNLWRTWITKRATTRSLLTQVWPLKNPWYTHASIAMVAHVCAFLVALLGCEVKFKEVHHTQKNLSMLSPMQLYMHSVLEIFIMSTLHCPSDLLNRDTYGLLKDLLSTKNKYQ